MTENDQDHRDFSIEEIIGEAARQKDRAAEQLSRQEIEEVGLELGLLPEHIDAAIEELERRKQARQAEAARRQRALLIVGGLVLVMLLSLGALAAWSQNTLQAQHAKVREHRAKVASAIERQQKIESHWQGRADSPDRDAEIAGSENRVRVARRRYDEAASRYNQEAGSLPHALFAPIWGLPTEANSSSAIKNWSEPSSAK